MGFLTAIAYNVPMLVVSAELEVEILKLKRYVNRNKN